MTETVVFQIAHPIYNSVYEIDWYFSIKMNTRFEEIINLLLPFILGNMSNWSKLFQ